MSPLRKETARQRQGRARRQAPESELTDPHPFTLASTVSDEMCRKDRGVLTRPCVCRLPGSNVVPQRTQHNPPLQCSGVVTSHPSFLSFLPLCLKGTPTTTALVVFPVLPLSKHLDLSSASFLSLSPAVPSRLPALLFTSFPESRPASSKTSCLDFSETV